MSDPDTPFRWTRRFALGALAATGLTSRGAAAATSVEGRFISFDPPVPMPAVDLSDRSGHSVRLASHLGRGMVVVPWATWCPACRVDLPLLAAAEPALARAGLDVALVNVETAPLATVLHASRTIMLGRLASFFDEGGRKIAASLPDGRRSPLQPFGLPILFVADRNGLVRGYLKGDVDWNDTTVAAIVALIA